jgi:hypothetical protein
MTPPFRNRSSAVAAASVNEMVASELTSVGVVRPVAAAVDALEAEARSVDRRNISQTPSVTIRTLMVAVSSQLNSSRRYGLKCTYIDHNIKPIN